MLFRDFDNAVETVPVEWLLREAESQVRGRSSFAEVAIHPRVAVPTGATLSAKPPFDGWRVTAGSGAEVTDFKFRHAVPVRFADLDVLGHVNHIAYLEILEAGRIAYYYDVIGLTSVREINFMLAEQRIRYAASALLGQTLEVAFRVDWLKRSSSRFAFQIRDSASRELLCEGDGVQVFVDLDSGRPEPLPDSYRERILRFEGRSLTPP